MTLYFPHSPTQSLAQIIIDNLQGLSLSYDTHILSSPGQPLTRAIVGKVLGPTYDHKTSSSEQGDGKGKMVYPGIAFDFGIGARGSREDQVDIVTVTSKGEVMPRGISKCILQVSPPESSLLLCVLLDTLG